MKEIKTSEEWRSILEQSNESPLFLLKHSSTCPVSAAGYRAFEKVETDVPKYFLVVQTSRPVSNEVESDLGIRHESPQLFLLKDGKAAWNASHYSIRISEIQAAVEANR